MISPSSANADRVLPPLRGTAEPGARLGDFIWFRTGGPAEWLVRPADVDDLAAFLGALPPNVPVLPVGVGSNLIVRDGGVPGVVIRLPKSFGTVTVEPGNRLRAGAAAMGITAATAARDAGIAGLEFLRGIPGSIGGAVRMNAGAYGREVADTLVETTVVTRDGEVQVLPVSALGYSYRHSALAAGTVVVEAVFQGASGDPFPCAVVRADRPSRTRRDRRPGH